MSSNKKKDFEDQLFKEKFETYKLIIDSAYNALIELDVNSDPFVKIYDIKDKNEWEEYFQKEVTKLYNVGFDLEKFINKKSIYLPTQVVEKLTSYSELCLGYVTNCAHYDTGLIVDTQDRLSDLYFDLVNEIRSDLKIDLIDESLKRRMLGNKN